MKFRGITALSLLALGVSGSACGSGGEPGPSGGTATSGGTSASGGGAVGGSGPASGGLHSGGSSAGASSNGGASLGGSGAGGSPEAGGNGPQSGGADGSGGAQAADFVVEVELASEVEPSAPGTVGIVTWSLPGAAAESARIEFGLTTDYGMTAPVDLEQEGYRTLLLGMKPEQTYHFRVVATQEGQEFVSDDYTVETGPKTTLASITQFQVISADKREPGFILTSYWQGMQTGMVFILDEDGEIVWWYDSGMTGGVAKAAISADGRDMWLISASNQGAPVQRVSLDTLDAETYPNAVGSHDIQAGVGGTMVFIEYGESDCDSAWEIEKDGTTKEVLELEDFTPKGSCHGNSLAYSKAKDSYVMSSLDVDAFVFPRAGGTSSNVTRLTTTAGAISTWGGLQHGVQLLSDNHLLIFANREGGNMGPSVAIEYALDSGEEVWRYEGGQFTANLGDVQRLPGGNTLVTYSNAGIIHEVTPDQEKVLQITAQKNLGYAAWRRSLYGDSDDSLE